MPPDLSKEVMAIVSMLTAPLQRSLDNLDRIYLRMEQLEKRVITQEEKTNGMSEDFKELKEKLIQVEQAVTGVKDDILGDQKKKLIQTIAIQSAIIFLFLAGFVTYLFALLPSHR